MRICMMMASLALLAGCASSGMRGPTEYQQLEEGCRARGGYLQPIPRANSSNPAANYACVIRGGGSPELR